MRLREVSAVTELEGPRVLKVLVHVDNLTISGVRAPNVYANFTNIAFKLVHDGALDALLFPVSA